MTVSAPVRRAARTAGGSAPLLRDAWALSAGIVLVGALGFVSWVVAARILTPVEVGHASALVSAMLLASSIGQLNMGSALFRWLPGAGSETGPFLRRAYAAVTGSALIVALAMSPLVFHATPATPARVALYVLAVLVWAVFQLQDQVLTALGRAVWVPAENAAFGITRLVALPLLAFAGAYGVLTAWLVPAAFLIVVVTAALPGMLRGRREPGALPSRRDLVRYLGGNWIAQLAQLAAFNGLPLVVTALGGAAVGGVFFIAWSVITSIELAASTFTASLVVRVAQAPDRIAALARSVAGRFVAFFVPALLGLAVFSDPFLRVFGARYAEEGGTALRLLAIGCALRLVAVFTIGVAQCLGRPGPVVAVQVGHAAALLAGAVVALHLADSPAGALVGVGTAYVLATAVVAVLGGTYLVRAFRAVDLVAVPAVAGAGPSRHRRSVRRGAGADRAITGALVVASAACWVVGARWTRPESVGLLGLVDALHPLAWVGLAIAAVAAGVEVTRRRPGGSRLAVLTVLLAVETYALQPLVYRAARLPIAYLHAGWTDYIARNGAVIGNFDARFSWPGFFEVAGLVGRAGGSASAIDFLAWAPVVAVLAWIPPLLMIGKALRFGERTRWLAVWIFLAGNWVEQEYYSPQALAYLLHLSLLAAVLTTTRVRPLGVAGGGRWSRLLGQDAVTRPVAPARQRAAVVIVVVLGLTALAVAHQLTPFMLVADLVVLAVLARLRLSDLIVIGLALPLTWLVLGAEDFWSGHFGVLTRDIGAVNNVVGENVGARLVGSPERTVAQVVRIGLTLTIGLLAVAGAYRLARTRRRTTLALLGMAIAPFAFVLVQSYGGELVLRGWLFALPWLGLLAAHALVGHEGGRRHPDRPAPWRVVAAVTAVLVLSGVGLVGRSANDGFVRIDGEQISAVRKLYRELPPGSQIAALDSYLPWKFDRIRDIEHVSLTAVCREPAKLVACTLADAPAAIVVTAEQDLYGRLVSGRPAGWTRQVIRDLVASQQYRVESQATGITVLRRHGRTLLAMGDSITRGDADPSRGLGGSRAWPAMVAATGRFGMGKVVNAGVPGEYSSTVRTRLSPLLGTVRPDVVFVLAGTNDMWGRRNVAEAVADVLAMAEEARAAGAVPLVATLPPQESTDPAETRRRSERVEEFNALLLRSAAADGVQVVDLHGVLAEPDGSWRPGFVLDGVHPTRAGAQAVADAVGEAVLSTTGPATKVRNR